MGQSAGKYRYDRGLGGVGKSTLVNHWLTAMAASTIVRPSRLLAGPSRDKGAVETLHRRCISLRGTGLVWRSRSTDGTAVGEGRQLANLVARRRTLLVLDGLEPLQYPPGPQEGRIRDASLQARFCASSLPLIGSFVCAPPGCRSPISSMMRHLNSASRPGTTTPAMPARNCFAH